MPRPEPARWASEAKVGEEVLTGPVGIDKCLGFHRWGYPNSCMVYFMENPTKMDGELGAPQLGNLHLGGWTSIYKPFLILTEGYLGFDTWKIDVVFASFGSVFGWYMLHVPLFDTCYIHATYMLLHMSSAHEQVPYAQIFQFYQAAKWFCKQWTTSNVFPKWFLTVLALKCKEIRFCLQPGQGVGT